MRPTSPRDARLALHGRPHTPAGQQSRFNGCGPHNWCVYRHSGGTALHEQPVASGTPPTHSHPMSWHAGCDISGSRLGSTLAHTHTHTHTHTHCTHVGHSIAERLSRLTRRGPCLGTGTCTCGKQGAVGMHTLYIALLSCKEGGKAARSEVQTLPQCEQCYREVMYVSERYGVC